MANPELIYGILGGVAGLLTVITGFIIKLHINRSKCANGMCFDCVCDQEELEHLERHRTEKRRLSQLEEIISEQPKIEEENIYNTLDRNRVRTI